MTVHDISIRSLGHSSEREREPQMIIQIVVPARWMTWFRADDKKDNGNANENKDAETKSCDGNGQAKVQERAISSTHKKSLHL